MPRYSEESISNVILVGVTKWLTFISYFFILAVGGAVGFIWNRLPPEIPWWYFKPWGGEQLLDKRWWTLSLGIWLLIFVLSRRLINWAAKDDSQVKLIFVWSITIVNLLFIVGVIQVIRLVVMI